VKSALVGVVLAGEGAAPGADAVAEDSAGSGASDDSAGAAAAEDAGAAEDAAAAE
jgi:hypothetical protein